MGIIFKIISCRFENNLYHVFLKFNKKLSGQKKNRMDDLAKLYLNYVYKLTATEVIKVQTIYI